MAPPATTDRSTARTIDLSGLQSLLSELAARGYETIGPQVRDEVIVHDRLVSVDQLPLGVTDVQGGGRYRLEPRGDGARFGYAVGPQSWKERLHPPRSPVWTMTRDNGELRIEMHEAPPQRRAFIGVRPCELAAIKKLDRVLLEGPHPDPAYETNRRELFVVAVNCGDPAETCFCPSMGTGPSAGPGYDLALTELVDGDEVSYLVEVGTDEGQQVLATVPSVEPTTIEFDAARLVVEGAARSIERTVDGDGIRDLIYDNLSSPQWDDIAERCLSCANCTLACPTCFCTDLTDVTDLTGDNTDRWRVWDSCFSIEFSHLGPGPVRASTASRYRQWFSHKLASWFDQFDESGCVGCGRCITWCPVGIDLTAELAAMRSRSTP